MAEQDFRTPGAPGYDGFDDEIDLFELRQLRHRLIGREPEQLERLRLDRRHELHLSTQPLTPLRTDLHPVRVGRRLSRLLEQRRQRHARQR